MEFQLFTPYDPATFTQVKQITNFLHEHLDEYGDKKEDIKKALQYAQKERASHGGFILAGYEGDEIVGTVVINKTGMEGYIPENILVYIAVHGDRRGKGYGKKLMNRAIDLVDGDLALHVEPDNPARKLYEHFGFTSKYLEMRLRQSDADQALAGDSSNTFANNK